MAKRPPTVRMRRLGAQLRKLREERGLTLDEAADVLKISKSALSRMENAQVITRAHEVDYILMKFGIEDEGLRSALIGLASAGRSRAWVKRHAAVLPDSPAMDLMRLEQDSRAIRTYQQLLIPGLLQTADYARAVMESVPQPPGADIERALAFRMARKDALTRTGPVKLDVVMEEAALQQGLGGAEIMRAQLRHMVDLMARPNINVQVLPSRVVKNPGVDGAFTMLDVELGDFTVVLIESLASTTCIEEERDVGRYGLVFRELQALASPPSESRRLIERAAEEIPCSPRRESQR